MAIENRLYPHLLPPDIKVWERFLSKYGPIYADFLYDVRVGQGRDPGQKYPENIRGMAIGLSQRRIDAIGIVPDGVHIIEVTQDAGLTAIGQLTMYPILYAIDYPDKPILNIILVCETIQSDIEPALKRMNVTVEIV
jgi:hypothetical protein